jgi:aryl-alcohol dehydrogenase-like predicted oxidoreductase
MNHLLDKGLILYWGTSMWRAEDIMKAHDVARERGLVPPQMEQPVYNMLQRDEVEREYVSLYDRIGLGVTSWSPLASGLLTGKYNDGVPPGSRASLRGYEWLRRRVINPENIETVRLLEPIARDMNCTMAQLALAWCARNENVSTVITGATSRKQVEENMRALDVVSRLDGDTLRRIEDILKERPRIELD